MDQKIEKEVLILDLNEIPLLVQAEVAQTPIEEVQVRIHLTQEGEVAEVEVLETKNIFISQICKNEKNLTSYLANINTHF